MAHIVILEDDVTLSGQMAGVLELEGHSVVAFETASAAIDHIKQTRTDLVIADLFIKKEGQLIGDGGITLISAIRQLMGLALPIIAISGSFSSDLSSHTSSTSRTVGANVTLAKPFHPDTLIDLVDTLLTAKGSDVKKG